MCFGGVAACADGRVCVCTGQYELTKLSQVTSRLTAATPMENPYCSCKLTRVRPQIASDCKCARCNLASCQCELRAQKAVAHAVRCNLSLIQSFAALSLPFH